MNAKLLGAVGALATAAALSACSLNGGTGARISCLDVASDSSSVVGDTVTLSSGLKYVTVAAGTGQMVTTTPCTQVSGEYSVSLLGSDSVFESTQYTFIPGFDRYIPGFTQGVVGMRVGGERILIVPPSLAYGDQANGPIPANSTLVFDVTVTNAKTLE